MDSSESPTHGEQEGSAYNGHFGCTCYHPLSVFNQFGDLERCALRPGNVHSADGWRQVLEPVVARYRHGMKRRYFRGDAAFAMPDLYEFLEAEGYRYTIRLPAKAVLQVYRTRLSGQWVALRGAPEGLFEPCGACVERAAMAVLLDQPFGVVANDKGTDGVADLVDGLEDASMHDLLLQRSERSEEHTSELQSRQYLV